MQLLETRLDNVVRRLGVGRSIWAARQIVAHGHVLVDGKKTDIASYIVEPGQVVTFKEGIHKLLRENMEQGAGHNVPGWLGIQPGSADCQDQCPACAGRCSVRSEYEPDYRILSVIFGYSFDLIRLREIAGPFLLRARNGSCVNWFCVGG